MAPSAVAPSGTAPSGVAPSAARSAADARPGSAAATAPIDPESDPVVLGSADSLEAGAAGPAVEIPR
jgi:hypothetical protein